METRSSKLRAIETLLLLFGAVVVALAIGEGGARLLFPEWAPRTALITKFWQYDSRYGWSHVPGASGPFQTFGIDTAISINQRGFRGPEINYERNGSDKRVLVLGDSFVWGFGVNYEDMFTTHLQKLLPRSEVVNLGVSGYSTDQELLLYQDEGRKYGADIVIVVVAANDRPGNERTVEYIVYGKPRFVIRNDKLELINQPVAKTSWLKRTAVWLAWRSYVLSQFHRLMYQYGATQTNPRSETRAPQVASIVDAHGTRHELSGPLTGWQITLQLLLELRRLAEKDGAEFLVVLTDGIGTPAAREMRELFDRLAMDAIFLDDYLDAGDGLLHLPDLLHWSPAANKVVASTIADKIKMKLSNTL